MIRRLLRFAPLVALLAASLASAALAADDKEKDKRLPNVILQLMISKAT